MANPRIGDVHVSAALTNLSVAWAQDNDAFGLLRAFPAVPVMKQADNYFTYDRNDYFRNDVQGRAPGTETAESGWAISTDNFFCNRIALGHVVSDPEDENAVPALNLQTDTVEYLTHQLMQKCEIDAAATYFVTGVWDGASSSTDMTGQTAPTSTSSNFLRWEDAASTPIEDINGESLAIIEKTGKKPNTLILGPRTFNVLRNHPDLLDRIKHTQRGVITTDLMAGLFDVPSVYVMYGTRDTSVEGSRGSGWFSMIGDNDALLCYAEQSPGLRKASAGYRFIWTAGGRPLQGARMKRIEVPLREGVKIEGEVWKDEKVVSSVLGAFFAAAVST
jgi:hypothetical protein